MLSLPALATITGSTQVFSSLKVQALSGGDVELPALMQAAGPVQVESDGASSNVDFSGLTALESANISLTVTNNAIVGMPQLRTFSGTLRISGGPLALPGLTNADNSSIDLSGGAILTLPAPTDFTAAGTTVAVSGEGSSLAVGRGVLDLPPSSGTGVVIDVPQLPQGMTLSLNPSGVYSGGTTFDIPASATVNLEGGSFSGGITFNLAQGATVCVGGGASGSGQLVISGVLSGSAPEPCNSWGATT